MEERLSVQHSRLRKSLLSALPFAAAIFAVPVFSAAFRLLLNLLFSASPDRRFIGPVLLATILAFLWFVLAFFLLRRSERNDDAAQPHDHHSTGTKSVFRTITLAAVIAATVATSAWTGLYLNDALMESRMLPWIMPLITAQGYGFGRAARMFPCQAEGFSTGCEPYKWIPTFLLANSVVYFPFVLVGVFAWQCSETAKKIFQVSARQFTRWGVAAAGVGLLTLQVMHRFHLETYDSLYPDPGISHRHLGLWQLVNDVTGTLIFAAGLLLPFYFYRAFRRPRDLASVRSRLVDLTSLAALMLLALMLGDVH